MRLKAGTLLACLLLAGMASVAPALAGSLSVRIEGIRNDHGKLLLALFDSPAHWPDGDKADVNAEIKARPGFVDFTFKDLKPGLYALGGFHDENANGKLDTNFLGIPTEGFFLSRDPQILFSTPSFDSVAVSVGAGDTHIVVHMKY